MQKYTLVITSCDRFDLLEATLRSLMPRLDEGLQEVVIAEDSGKPGVYDVVKKVGIEAQILLNSPRLGQLASIDRAYSVVKTDYIFHCEDDWEFFGDGFVQPSLQLLDQYEKISMVSLRARDDLDRRHRNQPSTVWNGISFIAADPTAHPEYFGYAFNPGMRRISDYRRFGPFKDYRGEREVSYCFKSLGYHIVALEPPAVRHIGWDRHIHDPKDVIRAADFFARLKHSVWLRGMRLKRNLFRHNDPAYQLKQGRGPFAESRFDPQLQQAGAK